ncbi:hypothetical protein DPMN_120868 [Dreissena polymorpha]|uniref:C-type lectin domain-containing protein n=1 Tax=Dreissena polymorpha TaxID=45954 RepID=A0A9D4GPR0_DREPO|nr:hypothetical protein DPMN_120868 [Dreissena polymorpha]
MLPSVVCPQCEAYHATWWAKIMCPQSRHLAGFGSGRKGLFPAPKDTRLSAAAASVLSLPQKTIYRQDDGNGLESVSNKPQRASERVQGRVHIFDDDCAITCYLLPLHWRLEWKKAQTTCERLGGYLAKNDIKELLDNEMARILHDAVESLWVGGYMFADDDGKWRWVDGNPISADDVALLSAVDARQWRDRCLEWLPTGWSEEDCVVRKHMLCEKEIS